MLVTFVFYFEYTVFGDRDVKIRIVQNLENKYTRQNAINIVPFGKVLRIDYKKQLNGNGKELVNLGRLSERLGGITLIGAESDNCGSIKKSIFVFEGAKLIAICDMNRAEEKYAPSFGYRIINFEGKKIGLIVDRDLFSPEAVKSLVNCGVSAIIDLYEGFLTKKVQIAVEFYAYVYGVDFVLVSQKTGVIFNAYGKEVEIKEECANIECQAVYRELKCKKRGI